MKNKFILSLVCLFVIFGINNFSSYAATKKLSMGLGAYINGKIGINAAEVMPGIKNNILLGGPDFGIIGCVPLSEDMSTAGMLEVGYTSLPFSTKIELVGKNVEYVFKYVTISPQFFISGFTVGLDIGFHNATYLNGTETSIYNSAAEGIYTAVKLGGMFPVLTNELGALSVALNGSYALTGIGNEGEKYPFHPASLSLGLNYMFNLE